MATSSFRFPRHFSEFSIVVLALLTSPGLLPAEVELSPLYSDNMVLQERAINSISGKATPGARITVTYKQASEPTKVKRTGDWSVELDLKKLTDTSASSLEIVEIASGHRSSVTLSNVVVGNVWLLGVIGNHGILANSNHFSRLSAQDRRRIRFLNVSDFESQLPRPIRFDSPAWQTISDLTLDHLGLTTFTLGMSLELGTGYVGVIQTSPDAIARLDRVKSRSVRSSNRRTEVQTVVDRVRSSANQEVLYMRRANQQQRINAKHEGIVRDLPLPTEYGLLRANLWGDFSFSSKSIPQLSFEGAIW